jgi:hypothetical protein
MELQNFTFEQFQNSGGEISAIGSAGSAQVDLESGDIVLEKGITITVDSEDITIQTDTLSWYDRDRILAGDQDGVVAITRSDGTSFNGTDFSADVRSRTWEFAGGIEGTYIDEEDEEDTEVDEGEAEPETEGEEPLEEASLAEGEASPAGPDGNGGPENTEGSENESI